MLGAPLCSHCGIGFAEPHYSVALCSACRGALLRHPLPRWMFWSGIVVLAIFVAGLSGLPKPIAAAHALDGAAAAEQHGVYQSAVFQLQRVVADYPRAARWTAQLGIDQYLAGDLTAATRTLDSVDMARLDSSTRLKVDRILVGIRQGTSPILTRV